MNRHRHVVTSSARTRIQRVPLECDGAVNELSRLEEQKRRATAGGGDGITGGERRQPVGNRWIVRIKSLIGHVVKRTSRSHVRVQGTGVARDSTRTGCVNLRFFTQDVFNRIARGLVHVVRHQSHRHDFVVINRSRRRRRRRSTRHEDVFLRDDIVKLAQIIDEWRVMIELQISALWVVDVPLDARAHRSVRRQSRQFSHSSLEVELRIRR